MKKILSKYHKLDNGNIDTAKVPVLVPTWSGEDSLLLVKHCLDLKTDGTIRSICSNLEIVSAVEIDHELLEVCAEYFNKLSFVKRIHY
ncbi:hypothetical protein Anas_10304 [Armadillidium nasatum]|uniref:Uncharacterized protein n=1 Tax=Armadillidium nasatum TaxID=96803 RepID=A0A5N5TMT5_9CRUS|nr:hypothetical protein Anas_10304 [Armadillidium nasatum]